MSKRLFIYIFSGILLIPSQAKADIEIVQKVVSVLERVNDEGSIVLQKFAAAKENILSAYEGINSDRLGFAMDKLKPFGEQLSSKMKLEQTVNPSMSDIRDTEKTAKDIEKNMLVQLGEGDETAKSQEQELMMKLIMAENVAKLYAKAFTTRTNLTLEKTLDAERTSTQDIIRSTTARADSIARRRTSLWDIESTYSEYIITDMTKELSGGEDNVKVDVVGGEK